jgi:hypothetical protein
METARYMGARVYAREMAEAGTRKREIGVTTARTLCRDLRFKCFKIDLAIGFKL